MCLNFSFELRGVLRLLANKAKNLIVAANIWAAVIFFALIFSQK